MCNKASALSSFICENAGSISKFDSVILSNYLSQAVLNAFFGSEIVTLKEFLSEYEINLDGFSVGEESLFISRFEVAMNQLLDQKAHDFLVEVRHVIRALTAAH